VPIFPERLPHWAMLLLSQMGYQTLDYARLTYLLAPLVREIMAIERRGVLFDPSRLTQSDVYWISYPLLNFLVLLREDLQIAAGNRALQRINRISSVKFTII